MRAKTQSKFKKLVRVRVRLGRKAGDHLVPRGAVKGDMWVTLAGDFARQVSVQAVKALIDTLPKNTR